MKTKTKKLIIFGTGDLAKTAQLYFERDTEYKPMAFTVDRQYLKETELLGLPIVPFDEVERLYPPRDYEAFVGLAYGHMNRDRQDACRRLKEKGYFLASYVSPKAYFAESATIGKNSFIFEGNVIQDFVKIGDGVIMWSGNHCGHGSTIHDNVFVSSHVVISGNCRIHSHCFIGVNATIGNDVELGANSWVSPGAIITKDIPHNSLVKSVKSEVVHLNEERLFK